MIKTGNLGIIKVYPIQNALNLNMQEILLRLVGLLESKILEIKCIRVFYKIKYYWTEVEEVKDFVYYHNLADLLRNNIIFTHF